MTTVDAKPPCILCNVKEIIASAETEIAPYASYCRQD